MADGCCVVGVGEGVFTCAGGTTTGGVAAGVLCTIGGIGGDTDVVVVGVFTTGLATWGEGCGGRLDMDVALVGSIL